jgi:S-adenosylmethionine:tRNA ribosyltransferase-isomerase
MLVSDFQYDLPPERIAQEPLADRAGSRLLQLSRLPQSWQDRMFREFPSLLRSGDLLVVNNTRVFPARLFGHRSGARGRIEVLLTRQVADDPNEWECLVRPGRKVRVGEKLQFSYAHGDASRDDPTTLEAEVTARGSFGERSIRFAPVPDFYARLERIGHVPLPPYIDRDDQAADRERYQTIYAQEPGPMARSVAAPTAGLHFTPEILEQVRACAIEIVEITLHVGLGTFQPIRVEKVEDHKLHREWYEISKEAALAINLAKTEGRRVVAVGTTTVRTVECAADLAAKAGRADYVEAARGEVDAFIYPGYRFRIVDALLTNFHLPQSTLLMLVCALGGKDFVMAAYRHAVEAGYRFYSYGDCMFVE